MALPLASLTELRLLRTSLSDGQSPPVSPNATTPQALLLVDTVIRLIEAGRYSDALRCPGARLVLGAQSQHGSSASDEPQHYYEGVRESAHHVRVKEGGALLTTAVGVAALYAFVQVNIVGPQTHFVAFPLAGTVATAETDNADSVEQETSDGFAEFAASIQSGNESGATGKEEPRTAVEWDDWARRELVVDGTDVVGRYALPQYLLLARILLVEPHIQGLGTPQPTKPQPPIPSEQISIPQGITLPPVSSNPTTQTKTSPASGFWWAARTLLVEQRLLSENSASLRNAIALLLPVFLQKFCSEQAVLRSIPAGDAWRAGEAGVVAGVACLEAGLAHHAYKQTEAAAALFQRAERECGLGIELTGALGYRTPHQVDAKAQMVVRTTTTGPAANYDSDPDEASTPIPPSADSLLPKDQLAADTQIFMQPRLVPSDSPPREHLSSIAQCLLLAHCLDVRKQSPSDELIAWQAAPFLEAVQAQKRQRPGVRATAGLARARWERQRGRTRERAFVTMQQLVDELAGASVVESAYPAAAASRLRYGLSVWFPSWAALQKELGEEMVRNGMVGAALEIFERLELWDNLIWCLKGLGKVAAATSLVRKRLEESPQDPRLWCSLGDLTLDDACYTKAWEVSAGRHARAQRSLAESAQGRGDFASAVRHWELALAINPLFSGAWFELAFAALKVDDDKRALAALTRTVQLEPDNGEAWNNIGALNLKAGNAKEAFIAMHEAIKYRHDQWQSWENFGKAAIDVGAYSQATRAVAKVLELSKDKRIDVATLRRLVEWVEKSRTGAQTETKSAGNAAVTREVKTASGCERLDLGSVKTNAGIQTGAGESEVSSGADLATGPGDLSAADVAIGTGGRIADVAAGMGGRSAADVATEPGGLSADDVAAAVRAAGDEDENDSDPAEERGLLTETEEVAAARDDTAVGEVLKRAVGSGEGGAEVWGLQARFFAATGDGDMAKECRLKQVRTLQSASWQHDEAGFEAMAAASVALAEAYTASSAAGSAQGTGRAKRELGAARMQLRGVIKQAQERFSDTASYGALETALAKVEESIKDASSDS